MLGLLVLGLLLAGLVLASLRSLPPRGEGVGPTAADPEVHAHTGSPPSLAVLPFEVLGDAPEQLYLARGLAAELTSNLSQLSGLTVIGTSPIGTGTPDKRPSLAAARYRLLGSVQRTGERIRLHLVIIETATGDQVWSRNHDRPFDEVLSLTDQAATALAESLEVAITDEERQRLARRCTRSAEAYDLFLRAQAELLARRRYENRHARELYLRALALDPTFARAFGGVALTHAADYRNRWAPDGNEALVRAKQNAQRAAELNAELPEVLWVLAYVHVREGEHESASEFLDRTLALDPSFADAYALKAGVLTYMGAPEDAVPLLSHAMRLNPRAGYLYYLILGRALFYLEDVQQAILNLREAASRNPANLEVRLYLAAALFRSGDRDAAEWEALEVTNLEGGFSLSQWMETHPVREPGHAELLISALEGVGL